MNNDKSGNLFDATMTMAMTTLTFVEERRTTKEIRTNRSQSHTICYNNIFSDSGGGVIDSVIDSVSDSESGGDGGDDYKGGGAAMGGILGSNIPNSAAIPTVANAAIAIDTATNTTTTPSRTIVIVLCPLLFFARASERAMNQSINQSTSTIEQSNERPK